MMVRVVSQPSLHYGGGDRRKAHTRAVILRSFRGDNEIDREVTNSLRKKKDGRMGETPGFPPRNNRNTRSFDNL